MTASSAQRRRPLPVRILLPSAVVVVALVLPFLSAATPGFAAAVAAAGTAFVVVAPRPPRSLPPAATATATAPKRRELVAETRQAPPLFDRAAAGVSRPSVDARRRRGDRGRRVAVGSTSLAVAAVAVASSSSPSTSAPALVDPSSQREGKEHNRTDRRRRRRNLSGGGGSSSRPEKRPPPRPSARKKRQSTEVSWLSHIDSTLRRTPVGRLPPSVLRQLQPAASKWARFRTAEGAERAHALLRRTINEAEAGNEHARKRVNTKLCNAALAGWARIGKAEEATKLLVWMNDTSKKNKRGDVDEGKGSSNACNYDVRPDTISYSTAIQAWAKSGQPQAPRKAEKLLRLMDRPETGNDVCPNTIAYNEVLHAWSNSDDMDKAVRAEELVEEMEQALRGESGNMYVEPDVFTYQSLMTAWSTSKVWGAAQRCEEILTKIDNMRRREGNHGVGPNSACYAAAVHAWSVSHEPDKARSAYRILQHMTKSYLERKAEVDASNNSNAEEIKPDVVVYTAAMGACSSPSPDATDEEKREAFDIATLLLEELKMHSKEYGPPNSRTYAAYLETVAQTLPPQSPKERDTAAARAFERCRAEGKAGEAVLGKMRRHFPHLLCGALDDEEECELADEEAVPEEWTRSAVFDKKPELPRRRGRRNATQTESVQDDGERERQRTHPDLSEESLSQLHAVMAKKGTRGTFSREKGEEDGTMTREDDEGRRRHGNEKLLSEGRDAFSEGVVLLED